MVHIGAMRMPIFKLPPRMRSLVTDVRFSWFWCHGKLALRLIGFKRLAGLSEHIRRSVAACQTGSSAWAERCCRRYRRNGMFDSIAAAASSTVESLWILCATTTLGFQTIHDIERACRVRETARKVVHDVLLHGMWYAIHIVPTQALRIEGSGRLTFAHKPFGKKFI